MGHPVYVPPSAAHKLGDTAPVNTIASGQFFGTSPPWLAAGQWEKTADGIAEMIDDVAKEQAAAKAREAHFLKAAKELEETKNQPEPTPRKEPNQSYPSPKG